MGIAVSVVDVVESMEKRRHNMRSKVCPLLIVPVKKRSEELLLISGLRGLGVKGRS